MNNQIKDADIKRLNKFLNQNTTVDFHKINLLIPREVDAMNWKNVRQNRELIFQHLKIYQRLLRVTPGNDPELIESLMKSGLHSAIQIASLPKSKFITNYASLFNNDSKLIEATYQKATAIRSQVLIKHIAAVQKAEPFANVSKLNLS